MDTVYFVVNEGECVFASYDEDAANTFKDTKSESSLRDTAEDYGSNIDELDDGEMAEMSFMSGYEGGYYYVDKVSRRDLDTEDEITTSEGDTIETADILEYIDD